MNWFIEFFSGDLVNWVVFWATHAVGVVVVATWAAKALWNIAWHLLFGIGHALFNFLIVVTEPESRNRFWTLKVLLLPAFAVLEGFREFVFKTKSTNFYSKKWEWKPLFHYEKRNQS